MGRFGLSLALWLTAATANAGEMIIPLSGEVPDDGLDHFFVPFDVPEGIVEIEVRHTDDSKMNVLDWGLADPSGFRGWGGGNAEPAVVGVDAASRSYVPGPIEAGEWRVVVGKAQISDPPGNYEIEVVLRAVGTLGAQARVDYEHAPALSEGPGWYAGDLHVHSNESGDARPPLVEIGGFARDRGLDFVVISDHNVHTAQDFFSATQPRHPELLFVPGVEFTTYAGHANVIGATQWVDHKIGQPGVTVAGAIEAYHAQGAVFSINHPVLELGPLCIGCAWEHEVDGAQIDAVEIATGGLQPFGWQFSDGAIAFWDDLCAQGHHVAAIGGSDDHKAGVDLNMFQSPIGDATTLVFAERLDVPSIVAGIANGRTVVKLQGPDDPTLTFDAVEPIDADTIRAPTATLTASVSEGMGHDIRLVHNGSDVQTQVIDADPFDVEWTVEAPDSDQDRYRVEVWVDGERRVISSHLWVETAEVGGTGTGSTGDGAVDGTTGAAPLPGSTSDDGGGGETSTGASDGESGCACTSGGGGNTGVPAALLVLCAASRRRPSRARRT